MGLLLAQAAPTAFADQLIYQIGIKSEADLLSARLLNRNTPASDEEKATDRRRTDLGVGEEDVLTLEVTKCKPNLTAEEHAEIETALASAEWILEPDDPEIATLTPDSGAKTTLRIKVPNQQQGDLTYPSSVTCTTSADKLVGGKTVTVKAHIPSIPELGEVSVSFTIKTPVVMIGKVTSSYPDWVNAPVIGVSMQVRMIPGPISVNFGNGVSVREIPRHSGLLLPIGGNTIIYSTPCQVAWSMERIPNLHQCSQVLEASGIL